MKSSAKKVELASVDDLFSTEESRADAQREKVVEIPLSELHPFKNHPFKVKDDESMLETADSIRQYGVLVPAIARPDPEGGYELVAGHRRHRASELAEKETMRSLSGIWTMTPPRLSWLTATYRGKSYIRNKCIKTVYDERGLVYYRIDTDKKDFMERRLIHAVVENFKIDR